MKKRRKENVSKSKTYNTEKSERKKKFKKWKREKKKLKWGQIKASKDTWEWFY